MTDIEDTIKALAPTRADGVPVPWRAPDGWMHLSVAMAKMASKLLDGPTRDWREAYPHIVAACNAPTSNGNGEGREAGEQLVEFLTDLFRREVVKTGYRPVGGGSPVAKMPCDWWDVDDPYLRFRTWSIDPLDVLRQDNALPCWIWVAADDFEKIIGRITIAKSGVGRSHVFSELEWAEFSEALALLARAVPENDPMAFLVQLLALSVIDARAVDAQKWFRGALVLREGWRPVPTELWEQASPDPRNDLRTGLIHISDSDAVHVLSGVMVNRRQLNSYLERNGFVVAESKASSPVGEAGQVELTGIDENVREEIVARVAKVSSVKECREWLATVYASAQPGLPRKGKAKREALEKWPETMTGRAFDNAWAEVSQERPWMTKAGRRPGTKLPS